MARGIEELEKAARVLTGVLTAVAAAGIGYVINLSQQKCIEMEDDKDGGKRKKS